MAEVTASFQSLSMEVIVIAKEMSESGLTEEAQILGQIQQAEKEKLELTVQWQVISQQENERAESAEEVEDFGASEIKTQELKKKYDNNDYLGVLVRY